MKPAKPYNIPYDERRRRAFPDVDPWAFLDKVYGDVTADGRIGPKGLAAIKAREDVKKAHPKPALDPAAETKQKSQVKKP